MKSNREIDQLIREAVGEADAEILEQFGEPSLTEMVTDTFRGRHRAVMVYNMAVGLVLLFLCIFCIIRMLEAADARSTVLWLGGGVGCFTSLMALKVWSWLEMQRHALVREIKRLELQVAQLSRRIPRE